MRQHSTVWPHACAALASICCSCSYQVLLMIWMRFATLKSSCVILRLYCPEQPLGYPSSPLAPGCGERDSLWAILVEL